MEAVRALEVAFPMDGITIKNQDFTCSRHGKAVTITRRFTEKVVGGQKKVLVDVTCSGVGTCGTSFGSPDCSFPEKVSRRG